MKALRLVVQVGLIALCLAPVGRQLAQDRSSISALALQLNPLVLAAASLVLVVSSLFLPVAMTAFTGGSSRRIGLRDSAVAYYASQPMKYLPGSFWILPGRVMLLRRLGHEPAASSGGLLFEMTIQAFTAALVSALLLGSVNLGGIAFGAGAGAAATIWLVVAGSAVLSGLLLGAPALLCRINRLPPSIRAAAARLAEVPLRLRLRNLAVTVLAYAAMWLVMGASFYLLLVAGDPRLDLALLKTALGVSTLSFLAGFLTPISPGGIGVREAAIVLLLAGVVSGPQATLVAVLARVLALVVEMGFALAAWLLLRTQPAPVTAPVSPRPDRRVPARGRRVSIRASVPARVPARHPVLVSHPQDQWRCGNRRQAAVH